MFGEKAHKQVGLAARFSLRLVCRSGTGWDVARARDVIVQAFRTFGAELGRAASLFPNRQAAGVWVFA